MWVWLKLSLRITCSWPHEVEPWFQSWYRVRVDTLDANYNLQNGGGDYPLVWGFVM